VLSVKRTDRIFFETFDAMAGGAVEAALILEEMFKNGASAFATHAGRIKEIEHRCDGLVHSLVKTLNTTFITPIDREDIHDLGASMDDVVDLIDAVASRVVLYKVGGDIPDGKDMARIIHGQSEEIRQAVVHLRDSETLLEEASHEIQRLMHQKGKSTHDAIREGLGDFFYKETNRRPVVLPSIVKVV